MGTSRLRIRFLAGLAGLALLVAASGARADDQAAIDKVTKLNKKAVDEYENLNFDQARKLLQSALDLCGRSGLDSHPVTARTHIHMGVVLFAGFKQKDDALDEFKKALQIQPDATLDKLLATPEIQEVFDQAAQGAKSSGGGDSGGDSSGPAAGPVNTDAITHEPITRAAQGRPISINLTLDSSVTAKRVVLEFSADGADGYGEREMQEASPGNWMGDIPASATEGAKVRYYIEIRGDDDKVLAAKGTADAPMVVTLHGANGQRLVPIKKAPPVATKEAEEPSEPPSMFFSLGLGSGFGWTTGTGEVYSGDKVSPGGFAPAKLGQITPEVGYFLSPNLILSVQLRLQLVTGATDYHPTDTVTCGTSKDCTPPTLAFAGFARAAYLFDVGDLHPFVGGVLGGGVIRHVASFASQPKCGANMSTTCVDTIESGPIFVGATGGLLYNLTPAFALKLDANPLLGFTKFTFNIDIDVGIAAEF